MSINNQTAPASQTKSRRKSSRLILAAAVVAVVVLAAVAAYALTSQAPQNPEVPAAPTQTPSTLPQTITQASSSPAAITSQNSSSTGWMVKGAYATYAGNTSIMGMDMNFTAKMTVVDLNVTHALITTIFNVSTPLGSNGNETTIWVEKGTANFQPEGLNITRSYETQVTVPKLGTRNCIAYEYDSEGINATYYVDSTAQWPIKIMLSSSLIESETYNIDIVLTDTNIAGL